MIQMLGIDTLMNFFQNSAVLLTSFMLFDYLWVNKVGHASFRNNLFFGGLLGIIGGVLMMTSWQLKAGIFLDTRTIFLIVAGLFYGITPTLVAVVFMSILRLYIGGIGLELGIISIVFAGLLGVVWQKIRPKWNDSPILELLAVSTIFHVIMVFFIPLYIEKNSWEIIKSIIVLVVIIYIPGTVFLGTVMGEISTHWRSRKTISDSEKNFSRLYTNMREAQVSTDLNGDIQYCNPAFEKLIGYSGGRLIGTNIEQLLVDIWKPHLQKILSSKNGVRKLQVKELEIISDTGAIIPVEIRYQVLKDEMNKPVELWMLVSELTDIKRSLTTLEAERSLLKTIVETIPDIVFMKDADGKFEVVNREFSRLVGISEEELYGKTDYDFYPKEQADFFRNNDKKAAENSKPTINIEWLTFADENKPVLLETIKTPMFSSEGELMGVLGIGRNITELYQTKRSLEVRENRLNEAQHVAQMGSWEMDIKTKETIFSDEIYHIFNIDRSKQKLTHSYVFSKINSDELETVLKIGADIAFQNTDFTTVNKLILDDKTEKYVVCRTKSEYDANNRLCRLVGTIQDITERELDKRELERALENVKQSDRLKTIFLGNISHEIRTPMNAIMGFSDLLSDADLSDMERDMFLGYIREAGSGLLLILNDIIDIAKIETGTLIVKPTKSSVGKELEHCFHDVLDSNIAAEKSNLKMNFLVEDYFMNLEFKTDFKRLKQVIENLLKNAIKYTETGTVDLGIELITWNKKEAIQIYVKDTGIGIPADKHDVIFEQFRQVEENEYHSGTGLGLSLCAGIIKLLKGEIRFESEEGKGSSFYVIVPLTESFQLESVA